jgi:hypothetical protein
MTNAVRDEPAEDPRRDSRYKADLLVCRLIAAGGDGVCLVRDMSAQGARAQTGQKLAIGQSVALEFGDLYRVCGTVRWVHDRDVGLEFDQLVDLSPLLEHPGEIRSFDGWKHRRTDTRRAFPRFRRCALTCVTLHGSRRVGRLHDLSPGGAAIDLEADHGARIGDRVACEIAGLAERTGIVRWVGTRRIGIAFDIPMPLRRLDGWAVMATEKCIACPMVNCPVPSTEFNGMRDSP